MSPDAYSLPKITSNIGTFRAKLCGPEPSGDEEQYMEEQERRIVQSRLRFILEPKQLFITIDLRVDASPIPWDHADDTDRDARDGPDVALAAATGEGAAEDEARELARLKEHQRYQFDDTGYGTPARQKLAHRQLQAQLNVLLHPAFRKRSPCSITVEVLLDRSTVDFRLQLATILCSIPSDVHEIIIDTVGTSGIAAAVAAPGGICDRVRNLVSMSLQRVLGPGISIPPIPTRGRVVFQPRHSRPSALAFDDGFTFHNQCFWNGRYLERVLNTPSCQNLTKLDLWGFKVWPGTPQLPTLPALTEFGILEPARAEVIPQWLRAISAPSLRTLRLDFPQDSFVRPFESLQILCNDIFASPKMTATDVMADVHTKHTSLIPVDFLHRVRDACGAKSVTFGTYVPRLELYVAMLAPVRLATVANMEYLGELAQHLTRLDCELSDIKEDKFVQLHPPPGTVFSQLSHIRILYRPGIVEAVHRCSQPAQCRVKRFSEQRLETAMGNFPEHLFNLLVSSAFPQLLELTIETYATRRARCLLFELHRLVLAGSLPKLRQFNVKLTSPIWAPGATIMSPAEEMDCLSMQS